MTTERELPFATTEETTVPAVNRPSVFHPTLNNIRNAAYDNSKAHGFWDDPDVNIPEKLMLMVSELSEALEEYRAGKPCTLVYYGDKGKPEGFPVELADALIRILDLCGYLGIDIEGVTLEKMLYNSKRPYKHNKIC